ncbi:agmatinase family protein [Ilyomonas limi]|uniref:Agmatinase family protein n=1 Tax=Ilyomonas limi TaxID=2575867 RepID=A0A4U3KX86_9BACT|nr:agmatinase family protein [Ilyomonas limi]TKK65697.1 agmatinase family protein [Ilyomonas limi]
MADLEHFDPNGPANPNNNIFGLPFTEEEAKVVILPVPWEVTVSSGDGTSRSSEQVMKASLQVDLFDLYFPNGWKEGFFMRELNRKVLLKSDYLRKEAELYIDYMTKGNDVEQNKFISKSLREINEGGEYLNNWVYEQTKELLDAGKLVGLLGGDHSTPLGYIKALAEKRGEFGILHIDAHCDLRKAYEAFTYSHASIMYNVLEEVPDVKCIIQVGIRDLCEEEWIRAQESDRVVVYLDQQIKERQFGGEHWKAIADEIISHLPDKVYISFDVDGLDPKLCPSTGTPVPGGFEMEQVLYLFNKMAEKGKQVIGFDLVEIGNGEGCIDSVVGARLLWRLCNLLVKSNGNKNE